ncbi:DEAD/DEAH box helicase [Streptomyces sp. NPDC051287]|uniref:DEAD/DEAH box helicase n=1 Tax=Streptomyces sp. NPDC051287 TaxID=3365648 RepID=UPI0037AE0223
MTVTLRPHQVEAVDAVLHPLSEQPGQGVPPEGLRTQVIAATGSGKTLIGVAAANRLTARRVLVLVPTLDLLVQKRVQDVIGVGEDGGGIDGPHAGRASKSTSCGVRGWPAGHSNRSSARARNSVLGPVERMPQVSA